MREPDEIERDIDQSRAKLDHASEELGDRVEHLTETAKPGRRPHPWGPWLGLAAAGLTALLLTRWLKSR
ncbi:MAG: DUF3618 domain-containing protein [Myxococcota bacterium]